MALTATKTLGVLALPVVGGAWMIAGAPGAAGAAAGVALVLALFGLTGLVLAVLADPSPSVVIGVTLGGLGVRVVGYLVALGVLASVDGLHRPSLALAVLTAFAVTLAHGCRVVSRTAGFFWVRTDSA